MSEVKIETADLEILMNLAEGFIAENGLEATDRYAPPERVAQAVSKARKAVRKTKR